MKFESLLLNSAGMIVEMGREEKHEKMAYGSNIFLETEQWNDMSTLIFVCIMLWWK